MIVNAGIFRGRRLKTLEGDTTRPTTGRVKESLMSTLYSALPDGYEGIRVLDAFAGSGALGIEALSRGAQSAVFCDINAAARKIIQHNLKSLGLKPPQARVIASNLLERPESLAGQGTPFDLIFLDPPYAQDPVPVFAMIKTFEEQGWLGQNCLISYECSKNDRARVEEASLLLKWQEVSNKTYGNTALLVWRRISK